MLIKFILTIIIMWIFTTTICLIGASALIGRKLDEKTSLATGLLMLFAFTMSIAIIALSIWYAVQGFKNDDYVLGVVAIIAAIIFILSPSKVTIK